jgi:hypothetical protein
MTTDELHSELIKLSCRIIRVLEDAEQGNFDNQKAISIAQDLRTLLKDNQIDYKTIV